MTASQIRIALERRARELCGPGETYVPEQVISEKCRPKRVSAAAKRSGTTAATATPAAASADGEAGAGPSTTPAARAETAKLERMRRSHPAPARRSMDDIPNDPEEYRSAVLIKYHEDSLLFIAYVHARFNTSSNKERYPDPIKRYVAIAEQFVRNGGINFSNDKNLRGLVASLSLQADY